MIRSMVLVVFVLLALGCEPLGPIPGGKLSGTLVGEPVQDWSFASDAETLELETRPDDPYSIKVWFASDGAQLWIAAGRATNSWAKYIDADPRVRVRIDGKLYERGALRVVDAAERETVGGLYEKKYDYQRDPEDESAASLFRLDPR